MGVSAYLDDPDEVVCLAEADDAMQDGLLHGVKVGLGSLQACIKMVLLLPFLQATPSVSGPQPRHGPGTTALGCVG